MASQSRAWTTIRYETEEEKEMKFALWLSAEKEHAAKKLKRMHASLVPPTTETREAMDQVLAAHLGEGAAGDVAPIVEDAVTGAAATALAALHEQVKLVVVAQGREWENKRKNLKSIESFVQGAPPRAAAAERSRRPLNICHMSNAHRCDERGAQPGDGWRPGPVWGAA